MSDYIVKETIDSLDSLAREVDRANSRISELESALVVAQKAIWDFSPFIAKNKERVLQYYATIKVVSAALAKEKP